jgi:pteridine reductase
MSNPQVALVTGGAVRLGREITLALARRGCRLVVHYNRSADEAESVCAEIRGRGGEAVAIGEDLSRTGSGERLAGATLEAYGGRLDILVNSASVFPPEPLEATTEEIWDRALDVNLKAPFFLVRHLSGALRASRGVVINMADLAGMEPWTGYAAHSIAKAGLVHLTRIAARALAPEVRVVGIAPGAVLPPDDTSDEQMKGLARMAALKRNGSPRDVVQALEYLLDAEFVTGEILVVDGGRLLRG